MSRRVNNQAQNNRSSPGLERKSSGVTSPKDRSSRAGSRSVAHLTPAQLEKKRANDREAQKAIRARTKERMQGLERRIIELTGEPDDSCNELVSTMRRNKELEAENCYIRTQLQQAGVQISPGGRLGPWEALSPNRSTPPHIQNPSMPLPDHPRGPASLLGQSGSQDQSVPYGYRPLQWPTASPYTGEQEHIKGESSPSPGPQISTPDYQNWPEDPGRVRPVPTSPDLTRPLVQPLAFSHPVGSQPYPSPYGSVPHQYVPHAQSQEQPQQLEHPQHDPFRVTRSQSSHGSQQYYGNYPPPS